ncbi:MAG TPA: isoprenyl transferase [Blastocatellia bacterium]|nr:isoprenyl transferase [Blastocatellia bacterium]
MIDFKEVIEPGSHDEFLLRQIDPERLPRHVAIIMDGNGRWAAKRNKGRTAGHRAGAEAVRAAVETSARLGLSYLTLYAFSVENWKRPQYEIQTLFALLKEFLRKELNTLLKHNIRLQVIGRKHELDPTVQRELDRGIAATSHCTDMVLNVALNYGGRAEILDAIRKITAEVAAGQLQPSEIIEETISKHLYTANIPDPDLLIRTSGEMRISNFLLWQIAYSEIYVTDVLWPDFRRASLFDAIIDYQKRERRFGGLSPQAPLAVNAK